VRIGQYCTAIHARRKGDYQRLEDVLAYCEETGCLRCRILRYFGETPAQGNRCGNCSSCKGRKSRSKEIIKTTGAQTMTEWHRLRKPETAAAVEARLAAKNEAVLWQTAHRSFSHENSC
jgi:superfamily II DNA helicase RecQ